VGAATGKKRWTFDAGADIASAANFFGDTVLFGSGDETLFCLSRDGKPKPAWTFKVPGGPVKGSPAIAAQRTFAAGCDSALHVLDVVTGKELASISLGDGAQVAASAAVHGHFLYVGTMGHEVLAVDWKKGEVAWRFKPAARDNQFTGAVAVTDDLVLAGCKNKRVYALDRNTGREVWNYTTGGDVESAPVVVGQRAIVGSKDGNLYVLDLAKGSETQPPIALGGPIIAGPAVAGGRVVIGLANKGVVYCLGKK
jgi:outer membrane protein assembly factor BamB